uniref:Uncharacterized protein n=1 Tax=Stomoxys calcitrans TaxID=35570 RepID=A0A1I8Q493_STOCA
MSTTHLFFVNNSLKISLYDQISVPCFSKHDLIYLTYDFDLLEEEEDTSYRDFGNLNYEHLVGMVYQVNWDEIFTLLTVDQQTAFMTDNILRLYDATVPIRIKRASAMVQFKNQGAYRG